MRMRKFTALIICAALVLAMAGGLIHLNLTSATELTADENTVLLFHMNENGGSTLQDASSNNNDGSIDHVGENITWTTGRYDAGLRFDGENEYRRVQVNGATPSMNPSGGWDNLTVMMWIYVDGTLGSDGYFDVYKTSGINDWGQTGFHFRIERSTDTKFHWVIDLGLTGNDNIRYKIYDVGGNNAWYHLALTYNGSTGEVRMYVNGVDVTNDLDENTYSWTSGDKVENNSDNLRIEAKNVPVKIDELLIDKSVLSASEIAQAADAGGVTATVTIRKLGISVSPPSYGFGQVARGENKNSFHDSSTNTFTVTNTGNHKENFTIKGDNAWDNAGHVWVLGNTNSGTDNYVLQANAFQSSQSTYGTFENLTATATTKASEVPVNEARYFSLNIYVPQNPTSIQYPYTTMVVIGAYSGE
jgi:hypothetical protein